MNAGLEKIVQDNAMFSNSIRSTNIIDSEKVDIQLPGEYDENGDGHYQCGFILIFSERLYVFFF